MAKTWYPVIDEALCIECGVCVDKCTHGVYDREQEPKPVVISPDDCVDGCQGCGSLCPSGAITYFGSGASAQGCGCDCEGGCCGT